MAKKTVIADNKHAFKVKTGSVFTGKVERETKTDIILDVGTEARSIITLAKSYIVAKDGVPYPVRRAKKRPADKPLVLTSEWTFSNQPLEALLFFSEPLDEAQRTALTDAVPGPLRNFVEWSTPTMLVAVTDEHFQLDVRITYNARARAIFAKTNTPLFNEDRYDVLVDGGIDDEPSDSEVRAFGKDILAYVTAAHATGRLVVAYVSFVEGLSGIERLAKAYPQEARRAVVASLTRMWREHPNTIVTSNMTFSILLTLAHERLLLTEDELAEIARLFELIASATELDDTWKGLLARFQ